MEGSYVEPFEPGSPIIVFGVCKVVDSTHPNFKNGDLIWGMTGWDEYNLVKSTEGLFKIQHTDVPLSYYTGILGMPRITAYCGFYEVCSPNKGDNHVHCSRVWSCWSTCRAICKVAWEELLEVQEPRIR